MKWQVAVFFLAAGLSLYGSATASAPLRASVTFGGPSVFHDPQRVRSLYSDVYVLDSKNHRIAVCSPEGEIRYSLGGEGELRNPLDMAFGPGDEIFVADGGNRRIVRYAQDGLLSWGLDYVPRSLIVMGDQLLVRANPEGGHLLDRYTLDGEPLGAFGELATVHEAPHLRNAMNRVRLARDGNRLLVGHQTLARVTIYQDGDEPIGTIDVRGDAVFESRSWFFHSGHEALELVTVPPAERDPSFARLVADVEALSSSGSPHGNYILGGVGQRGGKTYVLTYGVLYVYDVTGRKLQEWELQGQDGGKVNIHGMTVEDEMIWTWDAFHEGYIHGYRLSDVDRGK